MSDFLSTSHNIPKNVPRKIRSQWFSELEIKIKKTKLIAYNEAPVTVNENWAMKIKVYCVLEEREPDFVWHEEQWYKEKQLTAVQYVLHIEYQQ